MHAEVYDREQKSTFATYGRETNGEAESARPRTAISAELIIYGASVWRNWGVAPNPFTVALDAGSTPAGRTMQRTR